jgi:heme exporter protein C
VIVENKSLASSVREQAAASVAALLFTIAISAVFVIAPIEKVMGIIQKIFYFHLSTAMVAFLSFFVAFVCGLLYLKTKELKWDSFGTAAVELGVLFTTLVLLTGMLWGRPIWNTWWTWDPRLTTSLILWFIFTAYLILRASIEQESKRAAYCAVMAILGFADVPVVFLSARLWRTIHPVVIRSDSIDMAPAMVKTLLVCMLAFAALWGLLFTGRIKTLTMERRILALERQLNGEPS